jgi:hypothetical protein
MRGVRSIAKASALLASTPWLSKNVAFAQRRPLHCEIVAFAAGDLAVEQPIQGGREVVMPAHIVDDLLESFIQSRFRHTSQP